VSRETEVEGEVAGAEVTRTEMIEVVG